MVKPKEHWETVYLTKETTSVSWFQENTTFSMNLIMNATSAFDASIIDVGSGASFLLDSLIKQGFNNLTVLDIALSALDVTRHRLGELANKVKCLEADVTQADLPELAYDVWHDRAVFHFLTEPEQRQAYMNQIFKTVKPFGHVIISTFSEDGPSQCSGLPVRQYSKEALAQEFGDSFKLYHTAYETHMTPSGNQQKFIYCCFRREGL